jgi:hypothetical protein
MPPKAKAKAKTKKTKAKAKAKATKNVNTDTQKLMEDNATKIQKFVKNVQKKKKKSNAAIKLQKIFRGYKTRKIKAPAPVPALAQVPAPVEKRVTRSAAAAIQQLQQADESTSTSYDFNQDLVGRGGEYIDIEEEEEEEKEEEDIIIKKYKNVLQTNRYIDNDINGTVMTQLKRMRLAALGDKSHSLERMTLDIYEFAFKKFVKLYFKNITSMDEIVTQQDRLIKDVFEKMEIIPGGTKHGPQMKPGVNRMTVQNFRILIAAWNHFLRFFPNTDEKLIAHSEYNRTFRNIISEFKNRKK